MGGRGARSGIAKFKYGDNHKIFFQYNNVKFIKDNTKSSSSAPIESRTPYRVYASIDKHSEIRTIGFMDKVGDRFKRIDLKGNAHFQNGIKIETPHVQFGKEGAYFTRKPTKKERRLIYKLLSVWKNHRDKL